MRRKIAAVLMTDVADAGSAAPDDEVARSRRLSACEAVVRDIVARGGGRMLVAPAGALLAEFPSAVEAVRAAVDGRETLRSRNRALPPDQQVGYRFGLTISDVPDGEGEVPPETLADAVRLTSLAEPSGIAISRSVREAVSSKLNLNLQGLTVEGGAVQGVAVKPAPGWKRNVGASLTGLASPARWPLVALGVGGIAAAAAVAGFMIPHGTAPTSPPAAVAKAPATAYLPAEAQPQAPLDPAAVKKALSTEGGALEFKPALAPDPGQVLTAERLLPKAWRDCHDRHADTAVKGCKTLVDSRIAKGDELADILLAQAKAERERHELDKAIETLTAAIAAAPSAEAFSLRGTVYYDKEKWEEAISDYSETIRRDPGNGEAYNNRAWTYYRIGRSDKALADAEAAVRLLGKEAYVWDTRGHIHAELGHRDAAISDFRAALAIDPSNKDSKAGLARLGID